MSRLESVSDELRNAVHAASSAYEADIITIFGPIQAPLDDDVIADCADRVRNKNLLVAISTTGGNPHAAYRVIRCLQRHYSNGKITVLIDTHCESAGTLISLGADEIVMSEAGYLGPLDVQIRKVGEVGEVGSALTAAEALDTLRWETTQYVADNFKKMRFAQDISMTTRQAADLASRLAIGLFNPIYAQVDPMRLGEINRSVRLASEYAQRVGRNLKKDTIQTLVNGYPSHGFVIDREEAAQLFNVVKPPTNELARLCRLFRPDAQQAVRASKPAIRFLSYEITARSADVPIVLPMPSVLSSGKEKPNGHGRSRDGKMPRSPPANFSVASVSKD